MARRILVVDDDPDFVSILRLQLEYYGWEVETAREGNAAFQKIRRQSFDVVLSDIRMPGLDGIALVEMARNSGIQTPIVLMSGYTEIPRDDVMRSGASELMSKPFELQHLMRVLERWAPKSA